MKFRQIRDVLGDTPYMAADEGAELYQFVVKQKPARILELGHAHGASSLYMAAALDEVGQGHLDTVDLAASADRQPAIEDLLAAAGLEGVVSVHREKNSYNWFLKKKIEERTAQDTCRPCYDFCFIDGPKNWTIDGLAFFLVDKLLNQGGWILFDDYGWTHGRHEGRTETDGITTRSLSDEEVVEPHIAAIFQLLVMQHPGYSNFEIQDGWWAWAQKLPDGQRTLKESRKSAIDSL